MALSQRTVSTSSSNSGSIGSELWLEEKWTSFILWDLDREFQNAIEAYDRWTAKSKRRRSAWECIAGRSKEDPLARSLCLGSQVQKVVHEGQRRHGQKFDKGDATCHTILSAQLLRLQQEVCLPLLDTGASHYLSVIPHYEVLKAARGIRLACLDALQDQMARLSIRKVHPFLPPPRFSVAFCPLALQLQKDQRAGQSSKFQTHKVIPHDRYDDRESCPYCHAVVSVAAHSSLPQYRRILFESHAPPQRPARHENATFACTGCYKIFEDSYAFLDHISHKRMGSENSCLRRYSTSSSVDSTLLANDQRIVEQCLKNCFDREVARSRVVCKK